MGFAWARVPLGADRLRRDESRHHCRVDRKADRDAGGPGGDVYFIVDGQVEFDRAGERIRALGPGLLFGERAALRNGVTRAATATAVPGTVLWRISGEQVRAAGDTALKQHAHCAAVAVR